MQLYNRLRQAMSPLKSEPNLNLLLASGLSSALLGGVQASATPVPERPNILFIMVDDMGHGDIARLRGDRPWTNILPFPEGVAPPRTPHLDALADSGMILSSFYANASLCSPTRAAVMTGRYQHRGGVVSVMGQLGRGLEQVGLTPFENWEQEHVMLGHVMQAADYRTGMFGKHHLPGHPLDYGFDEYVGTLATAGNNFSLVNRQGRSTFYRGRDLVPAPGYWYTDVLADVTIKFMTRADDARPFFAYLPFTAPHNPYFGPNDQALSEAWDQEGSFGPREDLHQAYVDVIEGLDAAIGRIVAALDEAGLRERTLIFFTSDNGPIDYGSAEPLRGRKSRVDEGGIRVPTLVSWPGVVPEGSRSDVPAATMDLLPTFAAFGRAPMETVWPENRVMDGVDQSAIWLGGDVPPKPRTLFWEQPRGVHIASFERRIGAVREGRWKLRNSQSDETWVLFDLEADPRETTDLSAQHPEVADRLRRAFERWRETVYADAPFDEQEFIRRLHETGLINHEGLL